MSFLKALGILYLFSIAIFLLAVGVGTVLYKKRSRILKGLGSEFRAMFCFHNYRVVDRDIASDGVYVAAMRCTKCGRERVDPMD